MQIVEGGGRDGRYRFLVHVSPEGEVTGLSRVVLEKDDPNCAARTVARLARHHGATAAAPRIAAVRHRGLEAFALENAVEGCVRETYGALVARWQAARAFDPRVRGAYSRIASDEVRHAELSWAIARWAEPRLPRAARQRVHDARRAAVATLHRELAVEPSAELVQLVGLPDARIALALSQRLGDEGGYGTG